MTRDEAMEKIRKCLRLAASSEPHEAAAALRQAQALMQEHGISQGDVELADVGSARHGVRRTVVAPLWFTGLTGVIERAFGVQAIYHPRSRQGGEMEFVGIEPRAEIAGYAWSVLHRQLVRDRADYVKALSGRYKRSTKTRRGDLFAEGWVAAVARKVSDFAVESRDKDLVGRWLAEKGYRIVNKGSRSHERKQGDLDAMLDGHEAGGNAHLRHGMGAGARDALERW